MRSSPGAWIDRRQAGVAGPHAVVAVRLEMVEKGEQRRDVEMSDLQPARPELVTLRREDRQQLEAGGVARHGMRAGAAVARQVLLEEGRQRPCELSHRAPSPHMQSFGGCGHLIQQDRGCLEVPVGISGVGMAESRRPVASARRRPVAATSPIR